MKSFAIAVAAVQGLVVVGLLYLLEAVVRAFRPEWHLPFSVWWGLVFCLPGIAFAFIARKERF